MRLSRLVDVATGREVAALDEHDLVRGGSRARPGRRTPAAFGPPGETACRVG